MPYNRLRTKTSKLVTRTSPRASERITECRFMRNTMDFWRKIILMKNEKNLRLITTEIGTTSLFFTVSSQRLMQMKLVYWNAICLLCLFNSLWCLLADQGLAQLWSKLFHSFSITFVMLYDWPSSRRCLLMLTLSLIF